MAFSITVHHSLTEEIAPYPRDRRYAVPRQIHATASDDTLDVEVEFAAAVDDRGQPHCRRLEVRARDGGEVTGETLRRIPVSRLLGLLLTASAWKVISPSRMQTGMPTSERVDFYERYTRDARRPRRGSPLADDHLRQVAELYRAAIDRGDPPTQTIADEMHAARSTAARWVSKAREGGHLGKARRGTAGEAIDETGGK